jgi:hypothetical protein
MWIKKTRKEIIFQSISGFFLAFVIGLILLTGGSFLIKYLRLQNFYNTYTKDYMELFVEAIFLSFFFAIIIQTPLIKKFFEAAVVVCSSCGKVINYNGNKECLCGGKFELIEFMKYRVDDDTLPKEQPHPRKPRVHTHPHQG